MKKQIIPLRTKIFTLVFSLLFLIIAGMSAVFYFIQTEETVEQAHRLSVQTGPSGLSTEKEMAAIMDGPR
ncbi:hypothetical protein BTO30_09150 [Domibacillus antri]|uniref:Uncharacterized protein n=1 Tax=Domibacillus antri TaxID=1714264 RepID=A0A1Q8Q550_9BACI|nr:hypothetical protein [Domibacillus antri]OLN22469.1 hypothetical protein BTO30_09150 [Domibacillus antri]